MQESKEISDYKKNLRGSILETAMHAFAEKGIDVFAVLKENDAYHALGKRIMAARNVNYHK